MLAKGFSKPTDRVERLRSMIVDAVPCIEAERAVLITESYQATEGLPMIMRRAKALENILNNLTVTIRDDEPEAEESLDLLIPKYINSIIYGAFIEAVASENGARMQAMDAATSNAEEMISTLSLAYNRARQGAITQELTEIISGAEALN